jgi:nucleotide-binding universal stress UspA family protein
VEIRGDHNNREEEGDSVKKKILLPVDSSIHSRRAMDYAARISPTVKDLTYTLLHVQPAVSSFLIEEAKKDLKAKEKLTRILGKNREEAKKVLAKWKAHMMSLGIAGDRIELVTQARALGLSKDVLDRAQEGLYDAVAIGRRGLTKTKRIFMGSLTVDLVEHSKAIPVWVIDGDVASNKIMIAADGSGSSLRAVDHVAFMVGDNPDAAVTLFHVLPRLRDYCVIDFEEAGTDVEQDVVPGAQECIDHFYSKARKKFNEAGFGEDQIHVRVSKRTANVGKAIVDEARKGGFGTVVVGRRGIGRSFFMGSISRYVLEKTANRTVWVVN